MFFLQNPHSYHSCYNCSSQRKFIYSTFISSAWAHNRCPVPPLQSLVSNLASQALFRPVERPNVIKSPRTKRHSAQNVWPSCQLAGCFILWNRCTIIHVHIANFQKRSQGSESYQWSEKWLAQVFRFDHVNVDLRKFLQKWPAQFGSSGTASTRAFFKSR